MTDDEHNDASRPQPGAEAAAGSDAAGAGPSSQRAPGAAPQDGAAETGPAPQPGAAPETDPASQPGAAPQAGGGGSAEVDAIDARLAQIAHSDRAIDRLRDDPEVRRRLADYAAEFGEGDPTWWEPEFELAAPVASERAEQIVAAPAGRAQSLSDSIVRAVAASSAEQHARLSRETGIALSDLEALDGHGEDAQRRRVALEIARQIHAIDAACARYGLDRGEFERLEEGPSDRTAGTLVGRRKAPPAKRLQPTPVALMGTAKLAVPEAATAAPTSAPAQQAATEPPRRSWRLELGLAAAALAALVVVAARTDRCAGSEQVAAGATSTAPSGAPSAPNGARRVTPGASAPPPASAAGAAGSGPMAAGPTTTGSDTTAAPATTATAAAARPTGPATSPPPTSTPSLPPPPPPPPASAEPPPAVSSAPPSPPPPPQPPATTSATTTRPHIPW